MNKFSTCILLTDLTCVILQSKLLSTVVIHCCYSLLLFTVVIHCCINNPSSFNQTHEVKMGLHHTKQEN